MRWRSGAWLAWALVIAAAFYGGAIVAWRLVSSYGLAPRGAGVVRSWPLPAPLAAPPVAARRGTPPRPVATRGTLDPVPRLQQPLDADIQQLRARHLTVPIAGADVERWKGSFAEGRVGHRHEAVDIPAPRNTPIHAVEQGSIARLFVSRLGGLTVYQFDPARRFVYYYAHLDRYADNLHDGDPVARGQIIGFVGTTGDAPPDFPHLHFAIYRVENPQRWWEGTPMDPYLVFSTSP